MYLPILILIYSLLNIIIFVKIIILGIHMNQHLSFVHI